MASGWITGSCGHGWWAEDIGNIFAVSGRPDVHRFMTRRCPTCRERVGVAQGRPPYLKWCRTCGARISQYVEDPHQCLRCIREEVPLPARPTISPAPPTSLPDAMSRRWRVTVVP